jgi:alkanesulfonate monooxygenase SsuD/methylene tetrahydromethanopterin reductase-like flavin-dependent oxidoreductase (luciferase family)
MGLPLAALTERFEQLEETLQIADRMWAGDSSPFEGQHYRLARPHGSPAPVRRPRVLIGGTGEKKTLRLVARYADACNLFDIPDGGAAVRRQLEVLAQHCDDVGRSYDAIEKTLSTRLETGESSESFVRRCGVAAGLGIEHLVVVTPGPWQSEALETLATVITAVRKSG